MTDSAEPPPSDPDPGRPEPQPPPPPPPPPGYGAEPPRAPRSISVGAAVGGAFIPVGMSVVLFAGGLFRTSAGAIVFAAIALVGGGMLAFATKPAIGRGLGLGLMIGWAVLSIVSAGFCTGLQTFS